MQLSAARTTNSHAAGELGTELITKISKYSPVMSLLLKMQPLRLALSMNERNLYFKSFDCWMDGWMDGKEKNSMKTYCEGVAGSARCAAAGRTPAVHQGAAQNKMQKGENPDVSLGAT